MPTLVYRATCRCVTPNRVTAISHDERAANISHLDAGFVCLILIRLRIEFEKQRLKPGRYFGRLRYG